MTQSFRNLAIVALCIILPHHSSLAQDLPSTIVGCAEVSCPKTNGSDDTCTVSDETFAGIGLARIPGLPDSLGGLSLVKGVNISVSGPGPDSNGEDRQYKSVYYLGTPAALGLVTLEGCAVIFHSTVNGTKFQGEDMSTEQGSCPDIITQSCIDALTQQAVRSWNSAAGTNRCDSIDNTLQANILDECDDMTGTGRGLGDFSVEALSGLSSITADQNSSSNCWPITPKTDTLTKITEDTASDGYDFEDFQDQVYKVTPVLTILSTPENDTTSQLTCLKVITTSQPDNDGENAASSSSYNMLGAILVSALVSLLVL
ncbi:hypothetical protein AB5N19_00203 [Seiridium cardinale]